MADHPEVKAYPICSECRTPYVLRWGFRLSGGDSWAWYKDCKHKKAEAELVIVEDSNASS